MSGAFMRSGAQLEPGATHRIALAKEAGLLQADRAARNASVHGLS